MQVYAIGNPFGLDHTLTQGIISGLGRELQTPGPRGLPLRNVIQTDAAINPGLCLVISLPNIAENPLS